MRKKMMLLLIVFFLFFSLGIIETSAAPQSNGHNSKEVYEVTVHSKKVDEGFLAKYIYPWIPLITVILAALTGAIINHIYWKRREEHAKKTNLFNEKMRCYLSLARSLLEYNVCTDIMMRTYSDIEALKKQSNIEEKDNQELKNFKQLSIDYEKKRIEPFAKARQELSNAEVFFKSKAFIEAKNAFADIFKQIRGKKIKWDQKVFNQLIDKGIDLQTSMGNELKKEFEKQ